MKKSFKCITFGKFFTLNGDFVGCPLCNKYYSDLIVEYDYKKAKFRQTNSTHLWSKYLDILPNKSFEINFGEQKTPLYKLSSFSKKYNFTDLYLKDESKNPTGSFKDRGSLILVNCLKEWGIKEIFVVSSGNDAISTTAYAKKAGTICDCLISDNNNDSKKKLVTLFGGNVVERNSSYEGIFRWAIDKPYKSYNATGGFNCLKEEGIKTISFEIYEDLSAVPDVIVAPCGNGTLLFSIYKGFKELQEMKLIDRLPMLIGVQVKNAAPLKQSFVKGKEFTVLKDIPNSIAEGIIAAESYSSRKLMIALKESGGEIIEVTDEEIVKSLKEAIDLESIIPEPTAATVFAGIKKLDHIKNKKIVLILTAGGSKNLEEIEKLYNL